MAVEFSIQNEISIGNSTITPLGAVATFTGVWENVLDFNGVSIAAKGTSAGTADGTLLLEFSDDNGVNIIRSISIPVPDAATMLSRIRAITTEFFRLSYINGTTVQTTFRLQTIYHATENRLVSTLDQTLQGSEDVDNVRAVITGQDMDGNFLNAPMTRAGNQVVSIADSDINAFAIVTPGGSFKVAEQTHLVGDPFGGAPINTTKWDINLVGSGTQDANIPGELTMDTGTTANSSVQIATFDLARFIPANYNTTHHAPTIPDGAAYETDNVRRWGAFDATNPSCNGIWYELDSGAWYLVHCINGTPTRIAQAAWNGVGKDSFPTNSATANVYEIEYNAGSIIWRVNGSIMHRATLLAVPYANNIHFPVGMSNTNINGNTTDVSLKLRAAAIYTLGKGFGAARPSFENTTGSYLIKTGPGRLDKIIFSRTGSTGGDATVAIYDNTSAVAASQIGQIAIGGDDTRQISYEITTNIGLFVVVAGTGTVSITVTFD